jgi:hypothetical protein
MIDGTLILSWVLGVFFTIGVGLVMYCSMLNAFYEYPSIKHGRFWLCQGISAMVAICVYLTKIGVIVWN